jgi:hypothetical protein
MRDTDELREAESHCEDAVVDSDVLEAESVNEEDSLVADDVSVTVGPKWVRLNVGEFVVTGGLECVGVDNDEESRECDCEKECVIESATVGDCVPTQ